MTISLVERVAETLGSAVCSTTIEGAKSPTLRLRISTSSGNVPDVVSGDSNLSEAIDKAHPLRLRNTCARLLVPGPRHKEETRTLRGTKHRRHVDEETDRGPTVTRFHASEKEGGSTARRWVALSEDCCLRKINESLLPSLTKLPSRFIHRTTSFPRFSTRANMVSVQHHRSIWAGPLSGKIKPENVVLLCFSALQTDSAWKQNTHRGVTGGALRGVKLGSLFLNALSNRFGGSGGVPECSSSSLPSSRPRLASSSQDRPSRTCCFLDSCPGVLAAADPPASAASTERAFCRTECWRSLPFRESFPPRLVVLTDAPPRSALPGALNLLCKGGGLPRKAPSRGPLPLSRREDEVRERDALAGDRSERRPRIPPMLLPRNGRVAAPIIPFRSFVSPPDPLGVEKLASTLGGVFSALRGCVRP